ncbi:MAG: nonstructural protein [Arizlama microvirus]|nr:MAG: nonstructural protein [Arizlama microvirus]
MKVFTVYDCKAEAYLTPMFMQSRGVAIRQFGAAAADDKHDFCRFAEDYTLFELGDYDERYASFNLHQTPISLGKASELKAQSTAG